MKLFNQLKWYFLKEWKRYLGSVILLLIIAILQLFPPKIIGKIVDLIINQTSKNYTVIPYIILMLIIAIHIYIFRYIWRVLLFGASYKLAVELRMRFFTALSKKSNKFYLKNRTGDLITRATNDVDKVVFAAGEGVLTLVDSLIMGISVFFVMCSQISLKLTLISLIPMPIMALIIKKFGKELYEKFLSSQKSFSMLNDHTQECLSSIRMIRSFGLENNQFKKFKIIAEKAGSKNIEVANVDSKFDPVIHISISASNLIAIIYGGWLVSNKIITFGQLTSFIMYLGLMIWPMLALAWMFNIVERGSAAWERIQKIISYEKKYDNNKKIKIPKNFKKITVNIKEFKHSIKSKKILKNIFFNITNEKILGICGPTGSGKTSIIKIIQNNYKKYTGNILYDCTSIFDIDEKEWRNSLSIVNQNTFLFSDTIYNNIALGNPNASYQEIQKVSKIANIHEEIIKFPKGYYTEVGEKGIMLSGGQKQRITIARALLFNSKILILDNSFSAVDGITEKKILNNIILWKKNNKKTIIFIAHRLSSLHISDKIIVIKNGMIIQKGIHDKLIQEKNWYQHTFNNQKIEIELGKI
ncbi:ABC transporter transmembrane domain-containing protein [Buchnera aphidicola (Kurisakia onigurumii)]|uniref:ABC transporter transmembrane domain-containing protein n=1 Tax=Buchnera aphidicola TaxID=9 RepID=UPI0031B7085F